MALCIRTNLKSCSITEDFFSVAHRAFSVSSCQFYQESEEHCLFIPLAHLPQYVEDILFEAPLSPYRSLL